MHAQCMMQICSRRVQVSARQSTVRPSVCSSNPWLCSIGISQSAGLFNYWRGGMRAATGLPSPALDHGCCRSLTVVYQRARSTDVSA